MAVLTILIGVRLAFCKCFSPHFAFRHIFNNEFVLDQVLSIFHSPCIYGL